MAITKLRPTFTFTQDRLEQLKAVVPEAFADGKVNWETLRETLGDSLEDESPNAEHFGLFWPGKREARRLAAKPSKGTLVPAPGEGVNEDSTRNLFIEGDNLEVLKLLQKSYAGRVKLIYIDPPYNTGNDFVYKDDFRDPLEDFLRKTGQADEEGNLLTTNTRADGRFHSNWLNMMFPRLRLAWQLLQEDGVIVVSIDDNELHNLRCVMDELFGANNFVGTVVVQLNPRGRHLDRFIAKTHEYLVIYVRNTDEQPLYQLEKDERMASEYGKSDELGKYRELELRNRNPAFNSRTRPNLYYPIFVDPQTNRVSLEKSSGFKVEVWPKNSSGEDSCWTWGKDKFRQSTVLLVARQTRVGEWRIFRKDYLINADGDVARTLPKSLWLDKEINNDYGKKALQELFAGQTPFDFPKPPELIKKVLRIGTIGDDIALDFFSGSATLAQAVMELNREDSGNRRFILVQLPEPTSNREYPTIANLGKERIRRVIKKLRREAKGLLDLQQRETPEDLGFRVYKLIHSNFTAWQDYTGDNVQEVETLFDNAQTPLVEGWQEDGLLSEVLLLEGFPLDSAITTPAGFRRNALKQVESDARAHRLLACFDRKVHDDTIQRLYTLLAERSEDVFVCLDSALTDEAKMRLADAGNLKTI
jgi:adenine-specific DNA-methyltransferase